MNNLERLKELTEELTTVPGLPGLIKKTEGHKVIFDEDMCWGEGVLYMDNLIAVGVMTGKAGYRFEPHKHNAIEIGIVKCGRAICYNNGEEREIQANDVIVCQANTVHSLVVLEDLTMLYATIPPAEGYPK